MPHRRGRHHAEIGQHRVAAADRRHAVEDARGIARPAPIFSSAEPGSVIAMKCCAASASPSAALARSKKYCLKMLGSSVLPDLLETMNSVRARSIVLSRRPDLRRIGRIEHVQAREARAGAEGLRQHLGAEAGAAHAEQHRIGEAGALDIGGEAFEPAGVLELGIDDVEPAEPLRLVGVRSTARRRRPTAAAPCPPCASLRGRL